MIKVLSTNYSGEANRRRLWFFNEAKEKSNSSHHSETISPCEFHTRMFQINNESQRDMPEKDT